jgi:hypothetical protein
MITHKRYSLLWIILLLCSQDGLSANTADTTQVFYEDKTLNGFLDKAIIYQQKADLLNNLSIEWRKEVMKMDDPAERTALQRRIAVAEDSTGIYREMARVHFAYMNSRLPVEKQRSPYLVKDTVLDGITVYQYRLTDDFLAKLNERTEALSISDEPELDQSGTGFNFKIYNQTPYSEAQIFEYDYPLPAGVFYRIQLAVYKNRLAPDHFKGLSPITTEKIPDKNLIRFFVGKFHRYEDARTALVKVRDYGHTDAFIIGYYSGTMAEKEKSREFPEFEEFYDVDADE